MMKIFNAELSTSGRLQVTYWTSIGLLKNRQQFTKPISKRATNLLKIRFYCSATVVIHNDSKSQIAL